MPKKRLPKVEWKETKPLLHGSRQWESTDGLFRYQCIDRYDDIPMSPTYNLYQFKGGEWNRVFEGRSRAKMINTARIRKQLIEESEDQE